LEGWTLAAPTLNRCCWLRARANDNFSIFYPHARQPLHTRTHVRTHRHPLTRILLARYTSVFIHFQSAIHHDCVPTVAITHHPSAPCSIILCSMLNHQTVTPPTVVRSSRPINHFEDPSTPSSPRLAVPPEDAKQAKPMSLWHELLGCLSSPLFIAVSFGCAPCPTIAQARLRQDAKKTCRFDGWGAPPPLERVFYRVYHSCLVVCLVVCLFVC
jgi:hypothetical protein